MKRVLPLLLAFLLCFSLFSCDENENSTPAENFNPISSASSSNAHTHNWKTATCTAPKTCSICGVTEGDAFGHIYSDATCIEPKTCTVCGATEGTVNGHIWKDATCLTPKTCSICGATEGKANGHSWKEATCLAPKTCSVCAATDGFAASHTFSNGACTVCGTANPNHSAEVMVWIPTKGGTKYHNNPKCSNMKDPDQVAKSEAESQGFTPCKKCYS